MDRGSTQEEALSDGFRKFTQRGLWKWMKEVHTWRPFECTAEPQIWGWKFIRSLQYTLQRIYISKIKMTESKNNNVKLEEDNYDLQLGLVRAVER